MANISLKICSKTNNFRLSSLTSVNTFEDLNIELTNLTSIPIKNLSIHIGYPRKMLQGKQKDTLAAIGLKTGECLYVELRDSADYKQYLDYTEVELPSKVTVQPTKSLPAKAETASASSGAASASSEAASASSEAASASSGATSASSEAASANHPTGVSAGIYMSPECDLGTLTIKEVSSDNSCMFASMDFILNGSIDKQRTQELRASLSDLVVTDADVLDYIVDSTPLDYSKKMKDSNQWGGSIELKVFSTHYKIEIAALNVLTGQIIRFGEDKGFQVCAFVIFSGIHYDPVYMPAVGIPGFFFTTFPTSRLELMDQATSMVVHQHVKGKFTNTMKFTLRCGDCGHKMTGEKEALKHAEETSHTKFEEYKE